MVAFDVNGQVARVDLKLRGDLENPDIRGDHLARFTCATALDLMARGRIGGDACGTHVYPLDAFDEALTRMLQPGELQIKVMFDPRL